MAKRLRYSLLACLCACTVFLTIHDADAVKSSQAYFEQGMAAFNSANYGNAELLFRKVVDADDEYKDRAGYYLALSIYNQKKYTAAIFEFNRFLLYCNTAEFANNARFLIAESYFFTKEYIRAIEEYKKFIGQNNPQKSAMAVQSIDRIGEIYYLQKRYDEAIIEWQKAQSFSPSGEQAMRRTLVMGMAMYLNGQYDDALKIFEPIVASGKTDDDSAKAYLALGRIYQSKNKHWQAIQTLNRIPEALLINHPFYDAQYFKALSAIAVGDTDSARIYLQAFLGIGKNSEWYQNGKYELARIMLTKNKSDAIKLFTEVYAETKQPELKAQTALQLGNINLKDNPSAAILYLEDAQQVSDPDVQYDILLKLANAYIDAKRYDDAEKTLNFVLNKYSYNRTIDQAQFLLAVMYLKKGDMKKAAENFERIKEINPFSPYMKEASYYHAAAKYAQGDYLKAAELATAYVAQANVEKRYDAYILLLNSYIKLDDVKKTEQTAAILMTNYPRQETLPENIFICAHFIASRGGSVERYYFFITAQFPQSPVTARILLLNANASYKNADYKTALIYYTRFFQTEGSSNNAEALLGKANCLYNLGQYKEAIEFLKTTKVTSLDFDSSQLVVLLLGKSYYQTGDYEKAYSLIASGQTLSYSQKDRYIYFQCAIKMRDIENAKTLSEQIRTDKKLYALSLYDLGIFYTEKADYEAAQGYFARVIIETTDTEISDAARMALASIDMLNDHYTDMIDRLAHVSSKSSVPQKNAFLVIAYLKLGSINEATAIINTHLNEIVKVPAGEDALHEIILYHYAKHNEREFLTYTWVLQRNYKNTDNLVNYLTGTFYYDTGNYARAFPYLYKLENVNDEHRKDVLYRLGMISLYTYRNYQKAIEYLSKVVEGDLSSGDFYTSHSHIQLALIYHERSLDDKAAEEIRALSAHAENPIFKTQAENLQELLFKK